MADVAGSRIRLALIGVGNVGRRLLELLQRKRERLRALLGAELLLTGVADSGGAALSAEGLDLQRIVQLKQEGQGVAAYPGCGRPGMSALEMVGVVEAEILLEASPVNLEDGQPALGCIELALQRGRHVVTANKAPLVLAFPRLEELARAHGVLLAYDATVAGGLPAINLGRRDLAVAEIDRLEGILNLTTNYILTRMAEDDLAYGEALRQAQQAGHAEADPRLDVEGWDAASKLVILAHSVLGYPATLEEVEVAGITHIDRQVLRRATAAGKRIKLVAAALREEKGYRLSVRPAWLEADHPLAQLGAKQMGVVYHSDINGVVSAAIVEETPLPTAAAMLRDVVLCAQSRPCAAL